MIDASGCDSQAFLLRALSDDFLAFVGKCFQTLVPSQPFMMGWHLDLLAEYLEAVRLGQVTRLIINMPPRSLKSVMVSVAFPAWLLGHNPSAKIMAASYAQALAEKHSLDCRTIMQSAWYQQLFAQTRLSSEQNEKQKFMTRAQGMRLATSIWGTATGEGGDVLIADDPINPLQAQSAAMRQMVRDWFDHTFMTRLDNKQRGAVILVMQRLHVEDVSGHLLARGGWEHVCLPALNDQPQQWFVGGRHFKRAAFTPLHAAREDEALIERARRELGSVQFAAQYQQQPISTRGGMVELEWFARYG
jgi:hypothetical protein